MGAWLSVLVVSILGITRVSALARCATLMTNMEEIGNNQAQTESDMSGGDRTSENGLKITVDEAAACAFSKPHLREAFTLTGKNPWVSEVDGINGRH